MIRKKTGLKYRGTFAEARIALQLCPPCIELATKNTTKVTTVSATTVT